MRDFTPPSRSRFTISRFITAQKIAGLKEALCSCRCSGPTDQTMWCHNQTLHKQWLLTNNYSSQIRAKWIRYPDVACWSTSGQDCLLRQNMSGCLEIPAEPGVVACCWCGWDAFLKDPSRRGGPVPGGNTSPGGGGHSSVRLRTERDRPCGGVTVPGGGTTLGKPCSPLGPVWAAGLTITLPADALLPPVTTLLELPVSPGVNGGWLPVPSVLPSAEESRLREKRFGLRLKLATLLVTYCCKELKKLILSQYRIFLVLR